MDFSFVTDVVAALAVTALLAESYGIVRRRFVGAALAPFVLGVLFGLMALVQMFRPLEPFDGFIVDLRNIPIALAGAFLGWRGLLPCLAIGLVTRYGMGGIGAVSGMWGMALAGLAGMIWARKTAHLETRGFGALLLLGLVMSAHLLGGLVLPRDIAVWFFTTAAGPMMAMNLVSVPLIGALMERENRRILRENNQAASMTREPVSGLLTGPAFVRDLSNAYAAHPFGTFAGFLSLTTDGGTWPGLIAKIGKASQPPVDRHFLSTHFEHADLAGICADGRVLIPLSREELGAASQVKSEIRQALRGGAIGHARGGLLEVSIVDATDPSEFQRVTEAAALPAQPDWNVRKTPATVTRTEMKYVRRSRLFNPEEHDILFAKAEFLISRSRT